MPSHQRYCCVCKNYGGKLLDGKKVSMHRFPADMRVRKVWIQRCKNARPNFVFTNSDQTRLCGQHFVGKCGPNKSNPLPCYFPRADGTEKVYKISTLDSIPLNFEPLKNDTQTVEETATSDTEFNNQTNGFVFDMNDSMLDISLRLHDYGCPVPPPSRIRHQSEQTQPEIISVSTQTNESRISKTVSTQTHILETSSKGCQVQKPALTFEDIAKCDSKVLFNTGIPNSGTFKCLYEELKSGMKVSKTGRPKSLSLVDEFLMVLMRLRLGLLLEDLADRFYISVGTCGTIFNQWVVSRQQFKFSR